MKNKFLTIIAVMAIAALFIGMYTQDPTSSRTPNIQPLNVQDPVVVQTDAVEKYVDSLNGNNDSTALKSRGYKPKRGPLAGPPGSLPNWFQGNPANWNAFNGPTSGYVSANFNCVTSGTQDLWLILPPVNVAAGDTLSFYERSVAGNTFPDSTRVYYAANGDTVPGSGSFVHLGRFLNSIGGVWVERRFTAPTAGATARFAINYCVVNGGPPGANGNLIGIDYIRILGPGAPVVTQNYAMNLPTPGVNTNYVSIPHNANMIGFTNLTIEAWVKPGTTTTAATVLNKGAGSFDYQLGINATTMIPFVRLQGLVASATSFTVPANVWTHIAATFDGSNVRFYNNGALASTVPLAGTPGSSTGEMRIGRGNNDPGNGNIEELRLWAVARTQGAIDSNKCRKYPSQFNNSTGLRGLWHLDNNLIDSINGFNGTPNGTVTFDTVSFPIPGVNCNLVGITPVGNIIPSVYSLEQNYPNPFNPVTNIKFSIPTGGFVELKVYDLLGREVATLVSDPFEAGTYNVDFDASKLASGVYFYAIESGNFKQTKKMLLVK